MFSVTSSINIFAKYYECLFEKNQGRRRCAFVFAHFCGNIVISRSLPGSDVSFEAYRLTESFMGCVCVCVCVTEIQQE